MNEPGAALDYHSLTVYSLNRRPADPRLVRGYRSMDPARRPLPFKEYAAGAVPLPDILPMDVAAGAALSGRASLGWRCDAAALSTLLFRSAGVVRYKTTAALGELAFRAAGSAGNLQPLEVYVIARGIDGLVDGVYHYEARSHAVTPIGPPPRGGGPPALVVTGVPWRTAWKYTERGLRHLYWDCGTMLAHTLTVAEVAGIDARVLLGFVDDEVTALVGADGEQEFPLAVVALGAGEPSLAPAEPATMGLLAADPVTFPLITATQRAGNLPSAAAVEAWRMEDEPVLGAPVEAVDTTASLDDAFDRRSSTREFRQDAIVPQRLLEWGLAVSARPVPADFLEPGTTALSHRVAVHAVDGVEPGAYVWLGDGLDVVQPGDVRDQARDLCLGQALGGEGAYTVFHCADLDLLYFLGSRGYRALQLEAGVVEGRLHLAAFALGFGATGLTFYDDEVRRFFATRSTPMLVTAVGRPAYRARRGGRPRRPAQLGS